MGTYAKWVLWVGLATEDYRYDAMPEMAEDFIDEVMSSFEPVQRNDLAIQSVRMHGETVGFGVVIHELNWETEIRKENVFDPTIVTRAQETQAMFNQLLVELNIGILFRATIYHHINLG